LKIILQRKHTKKDTNHQLEKEKGDQRKKLKESIWNDAKE